MIIEAPDIRYDCLSHVFRGEVNDAYICKKMNSPDSSEYTMLVISDRSTAHKFLEIIRTTEETEDIIQYFTWKDNLCVRFPYNQCRNMEKFFLPSMLKSRDCEEIFKNMVLTCMSIKLPWPLLYLILTQKKLNLETCNNISFDYCVNLEKLDDSIDEVACLKELISIILILFDKMEAENLASYQVLSMKYRRDAYHSFIELYQDLKNTGLPLEKNTLFKRINRFIRRNKDTIFLIFKIICIVMGMIAILMILCQLIFQDIPFLRIFTNSFHKIGGREMWNKY